MFKKIVDCSCSNERSEEFQLQIVTC